MTGQRTSITDPRFWPPPLSAEKPRTTTRTLDPIRAAALQAAVGWARQFQATNADKLLDVVRQFEQYLTGEEADGPADG